MNSNDTLINRHVALLSLGSIAVLCGCSTGERQMPEKPNIVFILADDMGYGDVSALNEESKLMTGNIDRIAAEGIVFTDAHTCSSVSTPSRYGLLTGRYNWRSELKEGVLDGYSAPLIKSGRRTVAQMLKESGYATACIGKWHLGWNWKNIEQGRDSVDFSKPITDGPTTRGFDYFYGIAASLDMAPYVYLENDSVTALPDRMTVNKGKFTWWREGPTGADFVHEQVLPNLTGKAVDYIKNHANGKQPFFLYFPLPAPHTPILPTEEFLGKSGLNPYGDFVLMVDDVVGKVMAALDECGISGNTILVFSTDNGCSPEADFEELGAKGHDPSYIFRGYKSDLFEGGHRVPCMLRWPDRVKRHTVSQTVSLTDFYATFASIAGCQIKDCEAEDSYDMTPLLLQEDEATIVREATVSHSIEGEFTIRKGRWKLLLSPSSGGWSYPAPGRDDSVIATLPPVQLYDMIADPEEEHNLCSESPEIVNELTELMIRYVKEGRSTPGTPQKNDGPEVWEQLRWIEEYGNPR